MTRGWSRPRDATWIEVHRTLGITWLGHATVLLELDGLRLLTDPLLGRRAGPLVRTVAPIAPGTAESIDVVLLSHLHADHADVPSLRRLRGDPLVLVPRGAGRWVESRGIRNVTELAAGEETTVGPLRVEATHADHDGRRYPLGASAQPIGFVVGGTRSAWFAGDTDLFPQMAELAGSVELALLPIWGWGRSIGAGHLDPERAVRALALVGPRLAVPIHWGTFALPRPLPRLADPEAPARLFAALAARDAPGVEARVLRPGERTELA